LALFLPGFKLALHACNTLGPRGVLLPRLGEFGLGRSQPDRAILSDCLQVGQLLLEIGFLLSPHAELLGAHGNIALRELCLTVKLTAATVPVPEAFP
jgi:hypothetical protein